MEERELELAEQYSEQERSRRIEESRRALAPERDDRFDGEHCIECPTRMPPERLAMGRIRCVKCQSELERRRKLFGGRH